MRSLEFQDVFKFSKMLDDMQIKLDLNELMDNIKEIMELKDDKSEKSKQTQAKLTEQIGADFALTLVKNLHKAENSAYKFIAGIAEEKVEKVKRYKIKELVGFFKSLFEDPELQDFFGLAEVQKSQE